MIRKYAVQVLSVAVAALGILTTTNLVTVARGAEEIQPTVEQATGKMRFAMYKACQKLETTVTLRGLPIGKAGQCLKWGVVPWSPSYDLDWRPRWANGNYAVRLWITGEIWWRTTVWTIDGPCFDTAPRDPFGGVKIHAIRNGFAYITKDGQLALHLMTWGCPDGLA